MSFFAKMRAFCRKIAQFFSKTFASCDISSVKRRLTDEIFNAMFIVEIAITVSYIN